MVRLAAVLLALLCLLLAGCGKEEEKGEGTDTQPQIGQRAEDDDAGEQLGFPVFATKNTTRVGGADPVADAAAVAQAVYPGRAERTRPKAVTLIDQGSWQSGVAASVFMANPLRAPMLLTDGGDVPPATASALEALSPGGAKQIKGAQAVRVGEAAQPDGLRVESVGGNDVFDMARQVDALQAKARGKTTDDVIVVSAEAPEFAMPAAAWAAKSGHPVLFVRRDEVPGATTAALKTHQQPKIWLLGPEKVVSGKAEKELARSGSVTRIQGPDAVANAIAFARFTEGRFGWGVVDPGHGLVFASQRRPLDAAAASPLSATGSYGPLLLIDQPDRLPGLVEAYLLDIQPGYDRDPVRGVYNHGWLIGSDAAISQGVQARIDELLQIVPVREAPENARGQNPSS